MRSSSWQEEEAEQWGEARAQLLTSITQFSADLTLLHGEVDAVNQLLEAGHTEAKDMESELARAEASLTAVEARETELSAGHQALLEREERLRKELATQRSRVGELRCKAKKLKKKKSDRKMIEEDLAAVKERYTTQDTSFCLN